MSPRIDFIFPQWHYRACLRVDQSQDWTGRSVVKKCAGCGADVWYDPEMDDPLGVEYEIIGCLNCVMENFSGLDMVVRYE